MTTTILTLVILLVIAYYLSKRTKKVVTTTETTPETTPSIQMVYYKLYRCDTAENYEVGPIEFGVYSTGNRVEGATNVYYTISGYQLSTYGYKNILVTNTFLNGCAE